MALTLDADEELLRLARKPAGAGTNTDTVRLGLDALVRHAAYQGLQALRGSEPDAADVPRRHEPAAQPRRTAAAPSPRGAGKILVDRLRR